MRMIRLFLPLIALISGAVMFGRRKNRAVTDSATRAVDIPALVERASGEDYDRMALHQLLYLFDDDAVSYFELHDMLQNHGAAMLPAFLAGLEQGEVHMRENAAQALGIIGGNVALSALMDALNDYSYWVRGAAAKALGKLEDRTALDGLIQALQDPEDYVREQAAEALRHLGGAEAQQALTNYDKSHLRTIASGQKKAANAKQLYLADDVEDVE
jgi:hypothetical protein